MTNPNGAPPGKYYKAATNSYVLSPQGTYSPGGLTAPIADPGATYSAAGASAPTTDPAGTYSSPYALNRVYFEWMNIVPENIALAFTNATAVADYFGRASIEAAEAKTFFAGYEQVNGSAGPPTMYFTRDPLGQRPHLLGANLVNDTLAQLQAIKGSVGITFDGFNYSGNVDMSGVTSVADVAKTLQVALNARRQRAAVITGHITSHTVTFTGTIDKAQVQVDQILSGGPMVEGGIINGPGITAPGTNSQIIHDIDGNGGPGHYSTFHSNQTSSPVTGTFTETYGVLTVDSVESGTVALGEQLVGAGVTGLAPATGITTNVSGSGVGSQWIVNNAPTVGPETMTLWAPLIGVYENRDGQPIIGPGGAPSNEFLDVSVQGEFGFDTNPSNAPSYLSGTAADALGLTQASGALPPVGGGISESIAQALSAIKGMVDQNGNPVHYGSIFSNDPRFVTGGQIAAWADSPDGMGYEFLTTNRAAGESTPVTDPAGSWSAAGASAPTWGTPPANVAHAAALLGPAAGAFIDTRGYLYEPATTTLAHPG